MAIRDFFREKPEPLAERERSLTDLEQILAWLEELARIRTVMDLTVSASDLLPISAKVDLVGEETRSCTLSLLWTPVVEPVPGQQVSLVFPLDGQRFKTTLVYQGRGGYKQYRFALPFSIQHAERRDATRVTLRSREKFRIVVLQHLMDGLGLNGELTDLAMGGCAFLIHRVIQIQTEKRMPIHSGLVTPGTRLSLVRLMDLPHLPTLECGGRVSHMRQWSGGVTMGIAFENLGAFESTILAKLMTERVPGFSTDFPRKRRFRELTEEEREVPQPSAAASEPEPEPEPPVEVVPEEAPGEGDRAEQLHKRGKKVLVLIADELDRTMLMAALHQDGYRCLFEASSLIKALEHHRQVSMDLVLVDQIVGKRGALELIDTLRAQGLPRKIPVVVIQRQPEVRLTLAAKAGGVNLLVEHPVSFLEKLKGPMEVLLELSDPPAQA